MRLDAIAKVIRSKNAGPCLLTLDVMLPDEATFAYVVARVDPLRRQVARRYGRSENGSWYCHTRQRWRSRSRCRATF